jgi:hypothetical protein
LPFFGLERLKPGFGFLHPGHNALAQRLLLLNNTPLDSQTLKTSSGIFQALDDKFSLAL